MDSVQFGSIIYGRTVLLSYIWVGNIDQEAIDWVYFYLDTQLSRDLDKISKGYLYETYRLLSTI